MKKLHLNKKNQDRGTLGRNYIAISENISTSSTAKIKKI